MSQQPEWQKNVLSMRKDMASIAADHSDYNVDEEIGYVTTAFNNNWKLQKADHNAISHLMRQIASVGLTLNPIHQFAFIQDQGVNLNKDAKDKAADWVQRPSLKIEYKGLIELLTSSGAVNWIRPDVVREGDEFNYRGPYDKPDVAVRNPFAPERVAVVGVYAVAQLPDGQHFCEIMRPEELEEVKRASSGAGPWTNVFKTEMYKKSVIKRIYKTIPKTSQNRERLDTAIQISNKSDGFDFERPESKHKIDVTPLTEAIDKNDGFAIIDIMNGLDTDGKVEIFNGFKKGEAHSRKDKARKLMSAAHTQIKEALKQLGVCMKNDDEHGALEILNEISIKYITPRASTELNGWLNGDNA